MKRSRTFLRIAGAGLLLLLAVVVVLAAMPLPRAEPRFSRPEWIGPVHVVDVATETTLRDKALRVVDGRISRIADMRSLSPAERGRLVKPGGAFVVPGLWDMHAVLTRYAGALEHPLYLAAGVTRLRSILDCPAESSANFYACRSDKLRWNDQIRAGRLIGPLITGTGSYPVNGPSHVHRDSPAVYAAATSEQARQLVRLIASQAGAPDHIKTYDGLPRASFIALLEEASARNVEVSGHVPVSVGIAEASAMGLKAVAHARALPIGCSSREADIIRMRSGGRPAEEWMRLALRSQDQGTCATLWRTLRGNRTFVSPTLITRYSESQAGHAELRRDSDTLRATPPLFKWIWSEDTGSMASRSEETDALYARFYAVAAARTADAEKAGVSLLVGSDTGSEWVAPGAGLHQEMELWRRAGIAIPAILRAATMNAAAYFGHQDRLGRVAPGYVADLVFVNRNPLADLSGLRAPEAVMQEGRLYDQAALAEARAKAEQAAASWRFPVHFLRDLLRNPAGFVS